MTTADESRAIAEVRALVHAAKPDFDARALAFVGESADEHNRVFRYEISSSGVAALITYVPAYDGFDEGFTIYLYASDKRRLVIEDFLKARAPAEAPLLWNSLRRPRAVFVAEALKLFFGLIDGPLANVAAGKEWIDVPFDWRGYR